MPHADILQRIASVMQTRLPAAGGDPASSYVAQLLHKGSDAVLKKIAEEAAETIMAAKDLDAGRGDTQHLVYEVADLWFHTLVALTHYGVHPDAVLAELQRREGTSGIEEKAARPAQ